METLKKIYRKIFYASWLTDYFWNMKDKYGDDFAIDSYTQNQTIVREITLMWKDNFYSRRITPDFYFAGKKEISHKVDDVLKEFEKDIIKTKDR